MPLGTPIALAPLIVLIELIRQLIRPMTLAVRLIANITAGHLLITIRASAAFPALSWMLTVSLAALLILLILERAVALIQGFVFALLNTLYISENAEVLPTYVNTQTFLASSNNC